MTVPAPEPTVTNGPVNPATTSGFVTTTTTPATDPGHSTPPPVPAAPAPTPDALPAPKTFDEDYVKTLREEAAKHRTDKKAAEDQLSKVLAALGVTPEGTPPDPAELAKAVEAKDAEIRRLKTDQALNLALAEHGAKPLTLSAMRGDGVLNNLDPTSDTFQADVNAAVEQYVNAHPELRAGKTPPASGSGGAGGTGEPGQITESQLASMTPEQVNDALEAGRLRTLLGA